MSNELHCLIRILEYNAVMERLGAKKVQTQCGRWIWLEEPHHRFELAKAGFHA